MFDFRTSLCSWLKQFKTFCDNLHDKVHSQQHIISSSKAGITAAPYWEGEQPPSASAGGGEECHDHELAVSWDKNLSSPGSPQQKVLFSYGVLGWLYFLISLHIVTYRL